MKELFYSKGKFNPVYMWIFLLMVPLAQILFVKAMYATYILLSSLFGEGVENVVELPISDTFILGYLGFVAAWLGIYNKWGKNKSVDK